MTAPRRFLSRQVLPVAALGLALTAAAPAWAFLSDDEARRAILDLRGQFEQYRDQQRGEQARVAEEITQIRRSMLDLANQIEQLRRDMSLLRGKDEELAREISELQRRQKDLAQGFEARMREFEPARVVVDGIEITVRPEEKADYDNALSLFRQGDYALAAGALQGFRQRYPTSGYTESVLFWLGNALYGQRSYQEAIGSFQLLVNRKPDHPRVPEALLSIANCQIELKDMKSARTTLDQLLKNHPGTAAAEAAKERMALLR